MANLANNFKHKKSVDQNFVIALSGGIDSIVLLHYYYHQKKYNKIRAIHINHNLNKNSNQWQKFCQQFCQNLKIDLYIYNIYINSSSNIEEIARNIRYKTIYKNLSTEEILLTAHHSNDQAETVLLNLCRGSGVLGIAAMLAKNNQHQRPLIKKTKQWIIDYATKYSLNHIIDDSNFDTKFRRNFMRIKVLPLLASKYPNIEKTLNRVATNAQQSLMLNDDLAKIDMEKYQILKHILQNKVLNISNLKKLAKHRIINIIYYHLRQLKFSLPSHKILKQILIALNSKVDAKVLIYWGEFESRIFMGNLYFLPQKKPVDFCNFYQQLKDKESFNIKYREAGQRVKFTTKNHSQSLKKLMQEYKIPPWERDNIRLYYLCENLVAIERIGKIDLNSF